MQPPPDPPTPERFQATLGRVFDDWGNTILPTPDGGYLVAARSPGNGGLYDGWLVHVDALGRELESWFSDHRTIPTALIERNEGGLALVQSGFDRDTHVWRLDPVGRPLDLLEIPIPSGAGGVVAVPAGGYAIATGAELVRVDADGGELWRRRYEPDSLELARCIGTPDGGFGLLGTRACESGREIFSCPILIDVDGEGAERWRAIATDRTPDDLDVGDVVAEPDGRYLLTGFGRLPMPGNALSYTELVAEIDADGWRVRAIEVPSEMSALAIRRTTVGTRLLASERFGNRHAVLELDEGFRVRSTTEVDTGSIESAALLEDGGWIAVGVTRAYGAGGEDVLIARFDSNGRPGPPPTEPTFEPARSWTEPVVLLDGGSNARLFDLALDGSGGAVVVGTERAPGGELDSLWIARRERRDAAWTLAREVTPMVGARDLHAAALERGRAMLAWFTDAESDRRVLAMVHGRGPETDQPWTLATPVAELRALDLAASPSGVAAVLWSEHADVPGLGALSRLMLRRFDGARWEEERAVQPLTPSAGFREPRLDLADGGRRTTALWSTRGGSRRQLCGSAQSAPDAPFPAASCVLHGDPLRTQVAFDDAGGALAVWERFEDAAAGEGYEPVYARFRAGGGFEEPRFLEGDCTFRPGGLAVGASLERAVLGAKARGGACARPFRDGAWQPATVLRDVPDGVLEGAPLVAHLGEERYAALFTYTLGGRVLLWASISRDGGSTWSEPELVGRTERFATQEWRQLAGNEAGDVVVAWQENDTVRATSLIR